MDQGAAGKRFRHGASQRLSPYALTVKSYLYPTGDSSPAYHSTLTLILRWMFGIR